jgi:hypothetical protein
MKCYYAVARNIRKRQVKQDYLVDVTSGILELEEYLTGETILCGAGFCAAAGKVKNDLICETHLKFYFANLLLTQLIILQYQNSTANTT